MKSNKKDNKNEANEHILQNTVDSLKKVVAEESYKNNKSYYTEDTNGTFAYTSTTGNAFNPSIKEEAFGGINTTEDVFPEK